jgi:hypothetical protein
MQHERFYLFTRIRVRLALRRSGYDLFQINEAIRGLRNGDIDAALAAVCAERNQAVPNTMELGDGTLIGFIIDFLNSEAGQALIAALLKLLMGLIGSGASALAKPAGGFVPAILAALLLLFGGAAYAEVRPVAPELMPVEVDDAEPPPLTYPEAHAEAMRLGKPLVVWVGGNFCEACVRDSAREFVHVFVETFEGATAPSIVVGVVDRDDATGKDELVRAGTVTWWIVGDKEFGHLPSVRGAIRAWRDRREAARAARAMGAVYGASYSSMMMSRTYMHTHARTRTPLLRFVPILRGRASGGCST